MSHIANATAIAGPTVAHTNRGHTPVTNATTTPRTHTPDKTTTRDDGTTYTTFKLKRCCNGCGQKLGDADDRDVDKRGNLTDVRAECPACLPVVELERAGCKTWHLNPRSLTENSFARLRKQAKAYTEPDAQGRLTLRGIALDAGPGAEPVVARFGDWIIRHPDGRWSVRKAEAAGEVTR